MTFTHAELDAMRYTTSIVSKEVVRALSVSAKAHKLQPELGTLALVSAAIVIERALHPDGDIDSWVEGVVRAAEALRGAELIDPCQS